MPKLPRRRPVDPESPPFGEAGTIQARLEDGPLAGRKVTAYPVEGRPPKTIDVPAGEGGSWRYCLEQWAQEGHTADYTFLYRV